MVTPLLVTYMGGKELTVAVGTKRSWEDDDVGMKANYAYLSTSKSDQGYYSLKFEQHANISGCWDQLNRLLGCGRCSRHCHRCLPVLHNSNSACS